MQALLGTKKEAGIYLRWIVFHVLLILTGVVLKSVVCQKLSEKLNSIRWQKMNGRMGKMNFISGRQCISIYLLWYLHISQSVELLLPFTAHILVTVIWRSVYGTPSRMARFCGQLHKSKGAGQCWKAAAAVRAVSISVYTELRMCMSSFFGWSLVAAVIFDLAHLL